MKVDPPPPVSPFGQAFEFVRVNDECLFSKLHHILTPYECLANMSISK